MSKFVSPVVYNHGIEPVVPYGAVFQPSALGEIPNTLGAVSEARAVYDWQLPNGSAYRMETETHRVMVMAPEDRRGTVYVPGTKGYVKIIEDAIADYKENEGWLSWAASPIVWSSARSAFESSLEAGKKASPELEEPTKGAPSSEDEPKEDKPHVGFYILAGVAGIAAVGGGYMLYRRVSGK